VVLCYIAVFPAEGTFLLGWSCVIILLGFSLLNCAVVRVKITGRGIDVGENLRKFISDEVLNLIDKYIGVVADATVTVKKDSRLFRIESILQIGKGLTLKTDGSGEDPYRAFSLSLEKLEERIKRHKNRVVTSKDRLTKWEEKGHYATNYVLERKGNDNDDEEHLVIAEQNRYVMFSTVSDAVMKLDLSESSVVMFKNADSGKINVVYKRSDGHIGWIDYQE
jgi:ribosomal subunit interface protein